MAGQDEPRDLAALVVPQAGWLERAEDPWEPYRLVDQAGTLVGPVAAVLRDLQARQPVPAGPGSAGAGSCAPQPHGALPRRAVRAVPAPACPARAASHPGREVQRAVRRAGLAPRPGAGGVLGVYRGARIRAARLVAPGR